jgi:hypothetical protein
MNARGISSPRLLFALVGVAIALTIAGAVSFIRYSSRAAPDAKRVAVAPFDLFVSGHDPWRVQLARLVTDRVAVQPGWTAVPQEVVAQRWKGQDRAEAAAVELARRTQAGIAIYGRVDSIGVDSLRIHVLLIDALSTVVSNTVEVRFARGGGESVGERVATRIVEVLSTRPK